MSRAGPKAPFATRPGAARGAADAWVRVADARSPTPPAYTARLTIDVTPALRSRIKVTAFQRGVTVAQMLRSLLEREYDEREDGAGGAP